MGIEPLLVHAFICDFTYFNLANCYKLYKNKNRKKGIMNFLLLKSMGACVTVFYFLSKSCVQNSNLKNWEINVNLIFWANKYYCASLGIWCIELFFLEDKVYTLVIKIMIS